MAKIIYEDKEVEVKDGDLITDACEQLGVPFGCRVGSCGACKIEIFEGSENLSDLTQEEKDQGMDLTHRLACVVKIKSGTIKINF
jgi:ferredoxin